jgi:hypothetical protein
MYQNKTTNNAYNLHNLRQLRFLSGHPQAYRLFTAAVPMRQTRYRYGHANVPGLRDIHT